MGHGVLRIDLASLAGALHLPDGYTIIGVQQESAYGNGVSLLLTSDAIPVTMEGEMLPEVCPIVTVETLPEQDPAYRKLTTRIDVRGSTHAPATEALQSL